MSITYVMGTAGNSKIFEGESELILGKLKTSERFQMLIKKKMLTVISTDERVKELVLKLKTGKPLNLGRER